MEGFEQELISDTPEGGRVYRQTLRSRVVLPSHGHPAGEHIVVLAGRIRVGTRELEASAHFWTPPGAVHDAEALEAAVLIVIEPPLRGGGT